MGIDPARRAAIRVLGSGCFSHFGVLALERNNSTQFTPASRSRSTGQGNSSESLEGRPRAAKTSAKGSRKETGTPGRGPPGQAEVQSHLALRPVEVQWTLRDYP